MKKLCFTLFVLICLLTNQAHAQYELAKDGLGVRATFPNFQYPISNEWKTSDFSTGAEIEYVRHLNKALNLALPLRIMKARLPVDKNGGADETSAISLDATLQLKFFRENNFIYPYLYAGIGAMNEDFSAFSYAAPAGVGLNFRLATHTYLSLKGEYRFGFDELRNNVQLGAGLLVLLGEGNTQPKVTIKDTDGDGIPDNQDLCPTVAGLPQFNGCPDTDGDGIPDGEDECPTEAGPVATKGCPDRDGDGVPDKDDRCPDQPGPVALRGCPDRDGDGVPDRDDRCPDTPGLASNFGCPEVTKEDKETLTFAMKAVQFETAKSTFLPQSFEVLNRIVDILKRYPDYKMRISGHTDSVGSTASNQTLSERRAQACYDYFIARGISANRLSYAGYGKARPIADNRTAAGREQNRRVEFEIYLEE
jgi:OOP family OmpA-OmpF porin